MAAQERKVLEKTGSAAHADLYEHIDTTAEMEKRSET